MVIVKVISVQIKQRSLINVWAHIKIRMWEMAHCQVAKENFEVKFGKIIWCAWKEEKSDATWSQITQHTSGVRHVQQNSCEILPHNENALLGGHTLRRRDL